MNRITSFFQGLFAGMALIYTITLNLSSSVSADLVRVEDQALRVVAILSSFGAMYSFIIAQQKCTFFLTFRQPHKNPRHIIINRPSKQILHPLPNLDDLYLPSNFSLHSKLHNIQRKPPIRRPIQYKQSNSRRNCIWLYLTITDHNCLYCFCLNRVYFYHGQYL